MLNFCNGFFSRRNLGDAVAYGQALRGPENLRMSHYDSRALTFFVSNLNRSFPPILTDWCQHELLHLNVAADSPTPNPPIEDLTIDIKIGSAGRVFKSMAYGPFTTKILARWQGSQ